MAIFLLRQKRSILYGKLLKRYGCRKDTVRATRRHHKLSQGAFAKLIGVGLNTVWLWGNGRTTPRPKQQAAVIELRALGSEELSSRLSGIGLSAERQKPGRKKGTPAKSTNVREKAKAPKTAKKAAKKTSRRKKVGM